MPIGILAMTYFEAPVLWLAPQLILSLQGIPLRRLPIIVAGKVVICLFYENGGCTPLNLTTTTITKLDQYSAV